MEQEHGTGSHLVLLSSVFFLLSVPVLWDCDWNRTSPPQPPQTHPPINNKSIWKEKLPFLGVFVKLEGGNTHLWHIFNIFRKSCWHFRPPNCVCSPLLTNHFEVLKQCALQITGGGWSSGSLQESGWECWTWGCQSIMKRPEMAPWCVRGTKKIWVLSFPASKQTGKSHRAHLMGLKVDIKSELVS